MITPMIPATGLVGWQLLQTTINDQRSAFNTSTAMERDTKYFRENISKISSPEELVEDRTLLRVALSAFGLADEINNTSLLKQVLEQGTEDEDALANRLGDSRYVALANTFTFDIEPQYPTSDPDFASEITERYRNAIVSDLSTLLASEQYTNNPVESAILEASTLEVLGSTISYFEENIGRVDSIDKLLEDRDLLKVALTAFGVEGRDDSATILERALSEDPNGPESLVNIIGDRGLAKLSRKFGFYQSGSGFSQDEDFASRIVDNYQWQLFENSVDIVDEAIGNALSFQRGAPALASLEGNDNTKWYSVLGDTMMREVFQTALGLPSGFSQIDIDKQLSVIKDKSEIRYGIKSFSDLLDSKKLDAVIRGYLLQKEVQDNNALGSQQVALTLLSSIKT